MKKINKKYALSEGANPTWLSSIKQPYHREYIF